MTPEFDFIVIGSGPAGVSAAFPLVEAGFQVLMVDGGKKSSALVPKKNFIEARENDVEQWKWLIGENFYALKGQNEASPKLRVPEHAFAFEEFRERNRVVGKNFIAIGSLATGGLSNAWGCGVARFTTEELSNFPFSSRELDSSYYRISKRIGISGGIEDDLSSYFGLDDCSQPPISMDKLHSYIIKNYEDKKKKLKLSEFILGRSRVAALSEDMPNRLACNLSGNCLWGCQRNSLYSSAGDLLDLRKYSNFHEISGLIVGKLVSSGEKWSIVEIENTGNKQRTYSANKIIMAAGTLATTKIVLSTLNYKDPLPLLSAPNAAFLLWIPLLFGAKRADAFGLGQLSFTLGLKDGVSGFVSTFSTSGILVSEFARKIPLFRRAAIDLLRGLLSSCVVGNIFLPGNLTLAQAKLDSDGGLEISGQYEDSVKFLMNEARRRLSNAYRSLGCLLIPGSFTIGPPGGDIHYAGTLPMREVPKIGETSQYGEVAGLNGVYVVDGACLPTLPAKSHTLTIMANADRIGNHIVSKSLN